jgi:hypothetical protein
MSMADLFTHLSFTVPMSQEAADFAIALNDDRANDQDEDEATGCLFSYDGGELWVCHDDVTNVHIDNVVDILAETMERFDIVGAVVIEYADDCSSPLPGEIGGGVIIVTSAGEVDAMHTHLWAEQKLAELGLKEVVSP